MGITARYRMTTDPSVVPWFPFYLYKCVVRSSTFSFSPSLFSTLLPTLPSSLPFSLSLSPLIIKKHLSQELFIKSPISLQSVLPPWAKSCSDYLRGLHNSQPPEVFSSSFSRVRSTHSWVSRLCLSWFTPLFPWSLPKKQCTEHGFSVLTYLK